MALVLIQEDGTGLVDANAYANAAAGDAYHEGHLYATAWTGASAGEKDAALVMATRLIDAQCQFSGVKVSDRQALQWPRENCRDVDAGRWSGGVVASHVVPKNIRDATCEMARELLLQDRTAAPPGEGLKYQNVGGDQTGFSKTDVRPIISHVAQAMLSKFGAVLSSKSGSVRLERT